MMLMDVIANLSLFKMCKRAPGPSTDRSEAVSLKIDRELSMDKIKLQRTFKILLLGGAASGKSTIFKQMKILHLNGFTDMDWQHIRYVVQRNLFDSLKDAIELSGRLTGVSPLSSRERQYYADFIAFHALSFELMMNITDEVAVAIRALCHSQTVIELLVRKNSVVMMDSAPYFLTSVDRILDVNYKPTTEDALRTRAPTTGIAEIEFEYKDRIMRLTDVGGQTSEQRKWIRCFQENISAVLFILDLSTYNVPMQPHEMQRHGDNGDGLKNGMYLFKNVVEQILKAAKSKPSFIVFMNKDDIFREKLNSGIPLTECFSKYIGSTYEEAIKFLTTYVTSLVKKKIGSENRMFTHVTTATDTENIRVVFEDCTEAVLRANLANAGYT